MQNYRYGRFEWSCLDHYRGLFDSFVSSVADDRPVEFGLPDGYTPQQAITLTKQLLHSNRIPLAKTERLINYSAAGFRLVIVDASKKAASPCKLLDAVQEWLDASGPQHILFLSAVRLLAKLVKEHDLLPSVMFIAGPTAIQSFEPIDLHHGVVERATHDGKMVACKLLRVDEHQHYSQTPHVQKIFCLEAVVLLQLKHKRILPLLGIWTGRKLQYLPGSPDDHAVVTPWQEQHDLWVYLSTRSNITIMQRDQLLMDIAEGLAFLHDLGITHGRLCHDHVLVNARGRAVLCSPGVPHIGQKKTNWLSIRDLDMQTPWWAAPEMFNSATVANGRPPISVDIFAFALLCIKICTNERLATIWRTALDEILATEDGRCCGCRSNAWEMYIHRGARPLRPASNRCQFSPMTDTLWGLVKDCWRRDGPATALSATQVVSRLARGTN